MKHRIFLLLAALIVTTNLLAQSVAINTDGSAANTSAILDIKSTTKGLLIPRMTTAQRNAIAAPAKGLLVFDITLNQYWYYNGAAWTVLSTGSATNYWTTNGTAIYNNNAGNIGIGTSTPINKLQIGILSGSSITGNDIAIGNGTQAMSFFQSATNSLWYTTNNFALMPGVGGTGNLGIGTTTPATKLTVQTLNGNYGISHTDGSIVMATYIGNGFGWIGTRSNHPLAFYSNNSASPQMTLLANGNVGLGTTTPATKFTIHTPNNTDGFSHETDGGIILKDVAGGISAGIGTYSNHIFRLVANSVAAINIEPAGNVGIGYQTPIAGYRLSVLGNQYINGLIATTGNAEIGADAQISGNLNVAGRVIIGAAGQIGQFDLPPLEINSRVDYTHNSGWTYYGNGIASGGISIRSHGEVMAERFIAISDARVKNITGISNSAKDLETLNDLKITDYTMKDKIMYGNSPFKKVIAQEVEKVYPQVISKSVGYIPNVYAVPATIEKTANGYLLSFTDKHNLTKNAKKIQLMMERDTRQFDIVSIPSDMKIEIKAGSLKTDKVFVYGEEVDDFKAVDYEGLTTLNISATQELSKLIDTLNKKVAELQEEIRIIKAEKSITLQARQ